MFALLSAAWATPNLYAPDAADHRPLEIGIGPSIVLRGPTVLSGGRLDLGAQTGRTAVFVSSTALFSAYPDYFATAGVRYQLLAHDVHLAPFMVVSGHFGAASIDNRLTGRLGLALETGGEHLRFDLSLPLLGVAYFPSPDVQTQVSLMYPIETFLTIETGLSYRFNDQHRLRLGLVGIFPSVSYRYDSTARWFAEVLAGTMGANSLMQGRLGLWW